MLDPLLEQSETNPKPHTEQQFDEQVKLCRQRFFQKTTAYGSMWHFLRPSMITETIFRRAQAIRTDEEQHARAHLSQILPLQFTDLVNDTVTGLIQLKFAESKPEELTSHEALALYDKEIALLRALMLKKNHDYGEAWRGMRISTFTDFILMKLLRIKQIEEHSGETIISEGIDAGYQDIVNYSLFALIRMSEM